MPHGVIDEQDKRTMAILGTEDLGVDDELLSKFLEYLKTNIQRPCLLTGTEDFLWEEFYVLGPGDKKEYERLKKTRPSYTDTYELLEFVPEISEDEGIMVEVMRISDKKKFILRLDFLKAKNEKSPNFQMIDDYNVWFTNYR